MGGPAAHGEVPAAVGLAQHHPDLGHQRGGDPRHHGLVGAQDAVSFGLRADHQAGHVVQEHQGQVERIAQVDEIGLLGQRGRAQRARRG